MRFFSFLKDLVVVVVEKATFQTIQYLQKKTNFFLFKALLKRLFLSKWYLITIDRVQNTVIVIKSTL